MEVGQLWDSPEVETPALSASEAPVNLRTFEKGQRVWTEYPNPGDWVLGVID